MIILNDWKDLNKERPNLVMKDEYINISNPLLLLINEKIYLGHYTECILDSKEDEAWENCLELMCFTNTCLAEYYEINKAENCIYESQFKDYNIYWHEIDTLGIICDVEAQIQKEMEKNNGRIKVKRRTIRKRDKEV